MKHAPALALLVLAFLVAAAHGRPTLDVDTVAFPGGTLHLDRRFAAERDEVVAALQASVEAMHAKRRAIDGLVAREQQLRDEVNRVLGFAPTDEQQQAQRRLLVAFLGGTTFIPAEDFTVYVLDQENAKNHLRAGGTLPMTTYDPQTDVATFGIAISRDARDPAEKLLEPVDLPALVLPVAGGRAIEQLRPNLRALVGEMPTLGLAVHEVAEHTILQMAGPRGWHWRWFSDGLAEAITLQALDRLGHAEDAAVLRREAKRPEFEPLRSEANLRYWLAAHVAIAVDADVSRRERDLSLARYAFAGQEFERLIADHGLPILADIMDRLEARPGNTGDDMLAAISDATGEDFARRLAAYDGFTTREEGAARYSEGFARAREAGDRETALWNLLRLMELRFADAYTLQFYLAAADLHHEMGHTAAGERVLRRQWERMREGGPKDLPDRLGAAVIDYALRTDRLASAADVAEWMLARQPRFVPAWVVRLDAQARRGDVAAAAAKAREILAAVPPDAEAHLRRHLERLAAP